MDKNGKEMIKGLMKALSATLGTQDLLKDKIDKVYNLRENEYREMLEQEKDKEALSYIDVFSGKYTKQLQQSHAIVALMIQEESYERVRPLIKAGYNQLYRFVESKRVVTVPDIHNFMSKKKPYLQYTSLETMRIFMSVLYLDALATNGKFAYEDRVNAKRLISEWLVNTDSTENAKYRMIDMKQIDKNNKVYQNFKYLHDRYTKNNEFQLGAHLDRYMDEVWDMHPDVQAAQKQAGITTSEAIAKTKKVQMELMKEGKEYSFAWFLENIIGLFGFSENMQVHNLSKDESNKLLYMVCMYSEELGLSKHFSIDFLLLAATKAMQILQEYEVTKELYKETLAQDVQIEIEKKYKEKMDSLQETNDKLAKQNDRLTKTLAAKKEQEKEANKLIKQQEQELKRLRKIEESYKHMQVEVSALRKYSYQNSQVQQRLQEETNALSLEEMCAYLNQLNITIIGGNINWQNKLKEHLTNATFMEIDKTGSFKALNSDGLIVVINTLANRHANYERMLKHINPSNTICYLNDHVNVLLSIRSLYDAIKKG